MNFTTKKPPIVNNQSRSYKRSLTLHISLLIVAFFSVITRALITVPEGLEWQPDYMFKAFLMLILGAFTSVIIEILYAISNKQAHDFDKYSRWIDPINSGLLIALLLPLSTPIYALMLAVFIGVFIAKIVYGGYGYYIFHPALVGVLFVQLSFKQAIVYGETPLVLLKQVLQGLSGSINFDLIPLLLGNYEAVAIGSTSIIILGVIMLYLLINKVIDIRITGTFLGTITIISLIVGYISFGLGTFQYTIINLATGLTMFGAIFLVAENVTSPTSREAKMIYSVVVAIMVMIVRVLGSAYEGVIFAVLLGNMLTPFLNRTVARSNKQTFIKTSLILLVVVLFIGAVIGFMLQGRLIENAQSVINWMGGVM